MKVPFLIGRIVFGGYFIYNGIHHFTERKNMAQFAGAKHVPAPDAGVVLTGAMMLVGGTSVLLGLKPKMGTAVLIAFLAGVSPMIHDFWRSEDPAQCQNDMIHFMKNLALMGAAVSLMGIEEPWPASVAIGRPGPRQRVLQFARKLAA